MPLFKLLQTQADSHIALWYLDEKINFLKSKASQLKINLRDEFYKNEQQHKEYLGSRIALKYLDEKFVVDEQVEKNAPRLVSSDTRISISHCKKMCAVIYNNLKPVGIDVEFVTARILNVSRRFMNLSELQFASVENENILKFQFVIWSCKEAIFKKYHLLHLDFRENIVVEKFEIDTSGIIYCEVKTQEIYLQEKIFYHFFDDIIVTHTD